MLDRFRLTHRVFVVMGVFWFIFLAVAALGFNGMKQARDSMDAIHDVRMRATKRCEPVTDWGAASGKSGAAITADVWWRPRCTASNAWASG